MTHPTHNPLDAFFDLALRMTTDNQRACLSEADKKIWNDFAAIVPSVSGKEWTPQPSLTVKWWTVILLYPDYIADSFGETYMDHVRATHPEEAIQVAQRACRDRLSPREINELDDLAVVAVFEGEHNDVATHN